MLRHLEVIPEQLRRTLLVRGAALWLLARLLGKATLASTSTESAALLLSVWSVLMTASLTLIDLHRRHELTLLHNLGISTSSAVLVAAVPAIALEAVLVMLLP